MQDQFHRKIEYLRISITDFCNYRCRYCMPEGGVESRKREELLTFEELYYIVHLFVENGIKKVRITGGEPLLRKGIENFIESLGHIEKIKDLAMTTNASILADKADHLRRVGLKRVNISLDTQDPTRFHELTFGNIEDVKRGFHAALDAGLGVKINTVLLKGINDGEIEDMVELTRKYPIDVRFIEAMPIGATAEYAKAHYMSTDEVLERVDLKPVQNSDKSSPARMYELEGALGKVGLIQPLSHHFCGDCNRLRLTADGMIKPCLHNDLVIDIKTPLRKGEDIRPYIKQALGVKPEKHELLEGHGTSASMNSIGG